MKVRERLQKIPMPAVSACLASLTLGNAYGNLGFTWLRSLIMGCGSIFILVYLAKIILCPRTCMAEYNEVIPASLYASFMMCLMVLGSFYFEKGLAFGKAVWWVGVISHFIHILVFTGKHAIGNVLLKGDFRPMMPSWFVTYVGWLVACVTGTSMNAGWLLKAMTVYGCIMYPILLAAILRRMIKYPIKESEYHTIGVLLTPCSFCVIGLINIFSHPNPVLLGIFYGCLLVTLFFIIIKMPDFFSFSFHPGYASISFPMAIGTVATQKMSVYLETIGKTGLSQACRQLSGLQILLTSMIVGYIVLMFLRMPLRKGKK